MSEEPRGGCTVSEEWSDGQQFDPKIMMDLTNFKIGEWNDVTAQQSKFVERIDDNEPWLERHSVS